eukprot:7790768-Pyramimonas_sp.AAC.1
MNASAKCSSSTSGTLTLLTVRFCEPERPAMLRNWHDPIGRESWLRTRKIANELGSKTMVVHADTSQSWLRENCDGNANVYGDAP